MLSRYKFYKLASHLIRQDTRSKEYEDVTLDRNKKRLKPHQIEQLRYELKSLESSLIIVTRLNLNGLMNSLRIGGRMKKVFTLKLKTDKAFKYFRNLIDVHNGWGDIDNDDIYLIMQSPSFTLKTSVTKSWFSQFHSEMGLIVSD